MIIRLAMFQKATNSVKCLRLLSALVCGWIVVTAASAAFVGAQQTEVVDRIVAVVNSDIITLYDLNRAFSPYEANIKANILRIKSAKPCSRFAAISLISSSTVNWLIRK